MELVKLFENQYSSNVPLLYLRNYKKLIKAFNEEYHTTLKLCCKP